MKNDSGFLLGLSFCLLQQVRSYLILKQDSEGVEMIEDQYQKLDKMIEDFYYDSREKQKND